MATEPKGQVSARVYTESWNHCAGIGDWRVCMTDTLSCITWMYSFLLQKIPSHKRLNSTYSNSIQLNSTCPNPTQLNLTQLVQIENQFIIRILLKESKGSFLTCVGFGVIWLEKWMPFFKQILKNNISLNNSLFSKMTFPFKKPFNYLLTVWLYELSIPYMSCRATKLGFLQN